VVYQLLAFASGDGLQSVAEILVRWIDIRVFERLEQVAIFGTVNYAAALIEAMPSRIEKVQAEIRY